MQQVSGESSTRNTTSSSSYPVDESSTNFANPTGNQTINTRLDKTVITLNQLELYAEYLRTTFTDRSVENYLSFYEPHCILRLSDEKRTDFWVSYCDNVISRNFPMYIGERHRDVAPIVFEFLFTFDDLDDNTSPYNEDFVKALYRTFQDVITENFKVGQLGETEVEICAVVIETPFWKSMNTQTGKLITNKLLKFQFPYAKTTIAKLTREVIPRAVQVLRSRDIWNLFQVQPNGFIETQLVSQFYGDNLLYGSRSDKYTPLYEIKYFWTMDDNDEVIDVPLEEFFIPSNHSDVQKNLLRYDIVASKDVNYWLPLLLSYDYWQTILESKSDSVRPVASPTLRIVEPQTGEIIAEEGETHKDISAKYMEKAMCGDDASIIEAIIFTEWSPNITSCDVIYDFTTKSFFRYDSVDNMWKRVRNQNELLVTTFRDFVSKYEKIYDVLNRQWSETENDGKKSQIEITLKKIRAVIIKLNTQNKRNVLWAGVCQHVSKNVTYEPYHTDIPLNTNGYCNIFPGFAAKKVGFDSTDFRLKKLLDHIYVVWANRDQGLYKYILSWIAEPIRNLRRTNIALVLIGKPGCGKSMIFEFLQKYVYGSKISSIVDNFEPILQRFNSELSGKMLICVDETNTADSKKFSADFNKFKPKITGDFSKIERKGLEITTETNYNSFAICSNHEIPIKIEEGDRRYVVSDCNSEYVGNVEYFSTLIADCFNQGVGDIFYSYLRSEEFLEHKVPLIPAYVTKAKERIIDYQKPQVVNFFDDIFVNGGYPIPSEHIGIDKVSGIPYISSRELFKIFKAWCSYTLSSFTYKETGFCLALYKYDGISKAGRKTINRLQTTCASIEKYHETCLIEVASSETIMSLSDYIKLLQD